ncbi:unnamed protein product [Acanthoscelides obtectus]|uniref:DDE-1 domain-containing protein n=1 Tax=Acanthoscelides obtectus TaxID=200917 RepID=A0A9P0PC93_ACAOB|nr:unnamed protein product [Acanthoscelides obtectus]CAK1634376.1 hypothetical protein AOBTE_LOCUS8736 [Acanthoscelides obtectus]
MDIKVLCRSTALSGREAFLKRHPEIVERSSESVSAATNGEIGVPMIIYPYVRFPEKIAKTVNPEWGIGRSPKGWMTSETFYEYIVNVFHPHLVKHNIKFPVILFLDGHKSHLNYSLSLLCKRLQIEIFALYPNSTRILQPCDVAAFRPLKQAWRRTVREWEEEHPSELLNKVNFDPVVEKAFKFSIKPETLVNESPRRKGKKNVERIPFAITSKKCQEFFEKKQQIKEREEKEKEERKRKREEKANLKKDTKAKSQINRKREEHKCFICKNNIGSIDMQCETCKKFSITAAYPKHISGSSLIKKIQTKFFCVTCAIKKTIQIAASPILTAANQGQTFVEMEIFAFHLFGAVPT